MVSLPDFRSKILQKDYVVSKLRFSGCESFIYIMSRKSEILNKAEKIFK